MHTDIEYHSQSCTGSPSFHLCTAPAHYFISFTANMLGSVSAHAVLRARTFCTSVCCSQRCRGEGIAHVQHIWLQFSINMKGNEWVFVFIPNQEISHAIRSNMNFNSCTEVTLLLPRNDITVSPRRQTGVQRYIQGPLEKSEVQ